jgi:hypothetical protein
MGRKGSSLKSVLESLASRKKRDLASNGYFNVKDVTLFIR